MQIIRPEIIVDNTLVSSNVPETMAIYNAGTTYAKLAIVRRESELAFTAVNQQYIWQFAVVF